MFQDQALVCRSIRQVPALFFEQRAKHLSLIAGVLVQLFCLLAWPLPGQSSPTVVRQLLDSSYFIHQGQLHCRDFGLQEFEDLGLIRGCVGHQADSTFIGYETRSGRPLAFTTRFFVPRNRLNAIADSVRATITATLGPPLLCPSSVFPDQYWRLTQWHDGPLTVEVGVDSSPDPPEGFAEPHGVPSVSVQMAAAVLQCGDWIHDPLSK